MQPQEKKKNSLIARFFIFMKVQSPVNAYYQRLDFYYYFSFVQASQNIKNFSYLLFTKRLLRVCNDEATTAWSCCFDFFNANFDLSRVHCCYILWSGSSYVKNLPNCQWKRNYCCVSLHCLSSFLQNLKRILASYSQLYINCLTILLFIETCSKDSCTVFSILLHCPFYLFEHVFSFECV